ncbi:hypothetical protein BESB_035280 [Besnoitia besnoiti]|uniref:1-deoxy-D-xylulose 5-phosphate reductoisomerase, apicoplastic n=1 Tax=Besnoitia besnoiti TaxID=94643 RepID=A0A2A9MN51_BESBE|nr:hypothetical protein BESB_035280 [Besnoitia besnoiti]PFH37070.1 hypothetical protein BESB_035280 [Besnoitia besnoiti]
MSFARLSSVNPLALAALFLLLSTPFHSASSLSLPTQQSPFLPSHRPNFQSPPVPPRQSVDLSLSPFSDSRSTLSPCSSQSFAAFVHESHATLPVAPGRLSSTSVFSSRAGVLSFASRRLSSAARRHRDAWRAPADGRGAQQTASLSAEPSDGEARQPRGEKQSELLARDAALQACGVPLGSLDALRELLRRSEEAQAPPSTLPSALSSLISSSSPPSEGVKKIILLGSTGSIGKSTLEIVKAFPTLFQVVGLAAGGSNVELLAEQISLFRPQYVYLGDSSKTSELKERLRALANTSSFPVPQLLLGDAGLTELACTAEYDVLVSAIVGFKGVLPTLKALEAGKDVAFANKEALVAAGPVFRSLLSRRGALYGEATPNERGGASGAAEDTRPTRRGLLLPVDSEHSAIFQALQGVPPTCYPPRKLLLTATGGPFRGRKREALQQITLEDALKHPKWSMGAKITIDSATLMNKGLEVIEAHFAFGCPYASIEVLVHPQAIVHSAVELQDGATLAQLGLPDMKLPIAYALTWPHRIAAPWSAGVDLTKEGALTFEKPDLDTFGCLRLAYEAGERGGVATACLNAANEIAVERFRGREISFLGIEDTVRHVMDMQATEGSADPAKAVSLEDVFEADRWARQAAREFKSKN